MPLAGFGSCGLPWAHSRVAAASACAWSPLSLSLHSLSVLLCQDTGHWIWGSLDNLDLLIS